MVLPNTFAKPGPTLLMRNRQQGWPWILDRQSKLLALGLSLLRTDLEVEEGWVPNS